MKNIFKTIITCLVILLTSIQCKTDDNPNAISDPVEVANIMNENLILPPGSFTVDPSEVSVDNSVQIIDNSNGVIPISSGQNNNSITFNSPNATVNAVGMRFGSSGPIQFVPINTGNNSSGTGSFNFSFDPSLCDNLSQICHDIQCYEFAQTSSGAISAANITDIAMICGNCDEPSCQSLLDNCNTVSGEDGSPRFNLTWSGNTDLDLFVTDPNGETISFSNISSSSGGMLDVDCTGNCTGGNSENITWPNGGPSGTYSFFVNYFSGSSATNFSILVRDNSQNVTTHSGSLSNIGSDSQTFTYTKN